MSRYGFRKKSENFDFALYPKSKTQKTQKTQKKCFFTSNFDSSCNLRFKNDKKLTERKT